jgi:hypothetical protein
MKKMTIQEYAFKLIQKEGRPMASTEVAKRALEEHALFSNAKDPVLSLSATIDKNIRDGVYNRPRLQFLHGPAGRLIGLPSMSDVPSPQNPQGSPTVREFHDVHLRIPSGVMQRLQLAAQSRIAPSFDETVVLIMKKGLAAVTHDVQARMSAQLSTFDDFD